MYAAPLCFLAMQAVGTALPPAGEAALPAPQLSGPARLDHIVATPAHQPAWLSGAAVKLAVDEAAATPPAPRRPLRAYGAANPYRKFDREFDAARIPDCLHQNALKFQPPVLAFATITEETALLFVVLAKLRG